MRNYPRASKINWKRAAMSKADDTCRPAVCQPLATVQVFLVLLCFVFFSTDAFAGYLIGCITTIEKRFSFSSSKSGLILTIGSVAYAITVVFSSYIGQSHKPRAMAIGGLISMCGMFIEVLPHILYGSGISDSDRSSFLLRANNDICSMNGTDTCDESDKSNTTSYRLFCLGEIIRSMGGSMFFTLGFSYVDDNVRNKNSSPIYIGILSAARPIGPALGLLFSSMFLRIFADVTKETTLTQSDPQWVGAWWLGMVVIMGATVVLMVPMAMFPRKLPEKQEDDDAGDGDIAAVTPTEKGPAAVPEKRANVLAMLKNSPKDLALKIWSIISNPMYMCVVLGFCFKLYTIIALSLFIPKYMESQFHMTASTANLLTSIAALLAVFGLIFGGWLMRTMRLLPKGAVVLIIICLGIYASFILPMLFLGCDGEQFAATSGSDGFLNLTAECNANCDCNKNLYHSICGSDNWTYFSPCHAGCLNETTIGEEEVYSNCMCIDAGNGHAVDGQCDVECGIKMYIYVACLILGGALSSPSETAAMTLIIRSVDDELKPLALALSTFLLSIFTFLPGPIITGAMVDTACTLWQDNLCGETGNCWLYDKTSFRYVVHGMALVVLVVSALFYLTALCLAKGPYRGDPEDDAAALVEKSKSAVNSSANSIDSRTDLVKAAGDSLEKF